MTELLAILFLDPIPIGAHWYLLLGPLSAGIAVIYKTLKVPHVRQVPAAAAVLTVTILAGMAAAAGFLYLLYRVLGFWLA